MSAMSTELRWFIPEFVILNIREETSLNWSFLLVQKTNYVKIMCKIGSQYLPQIVTGPFYKVLFL